MSVVPTTAPPGPAPATPLEASRERRGLRLAFWILAIAAVVFNVLVAAAILPPALSAVLELLALMVIPLAFFTVHSSRRYGWRGTVMFAAFCLVVSNIFENMSILTAFPFGDYFYTGPGKIFLVPFYIGFAYLGTGYLSWVLATVIVGPVRRMSSWFTTLTVPLVGAFFMVAWDLSMDPTKATVQHHWLWQDGGGFFGVPLTNYLGWYFVVWVFLQMFALFIRFYGSTDTTLTERDLPRTFDAQAIVLYVAVAATFITTWYTFSGDSTITDPTGQEWQTANIAEASAIMAIFVMLFGATIAAVRLAQGHRESRTLHQ